MVLASLLEQHISWRRRRPTTEEEEAEEEDWAEWDDTPATPKAKTSQDKSGPPAALQGVRSRGQPDRRPGAQLWDTMKWKCVIFTVTVFSRLTACHVV